MTALFADLGNDFGAQLMGRVPPRRTAGAADALDIIQFLLSDASTFVTGQHVAVDGGYTIA